MLYKVLAYLQCLFPQRFPPRCPGTENIPKTVPLFFVPITDPGGMLFFSLHNKPPPGFMGAELFEIPLFGSLIRMLHAFPVKRNTADRAAIRKA